MSDQEYFNTESRNRRRRCALDEKCINGITHGPPVEGRTKCAWCIVVHREGAAEAMRLAGEDPANAQPPPNHRLQIRRSSDPG